MIGALLAVPYEPPPPPRNPWQGLKLYWHGPDGGPGWELTSAKSGAFLRPGVRGLTMPPFDHFTSRPAAGHGQRFRGFVAGPREVFWPLRLWNDTNDLRWLEYDAAFWESLRPDAYGTWTAEHPDGTTRTLQLRLVDDGDHSWDRTPGLRGWADYAITLVADDPFWAGDPITRSWGQDEEERDFIPEGGAPDFWISGASTVGSATMTNPGDVESPVLWEAEGPTTSLSLSVGADTIGVPFPLLEGQRLVIDTEVPQALLDGVDVTGDLNPAGFASIPPGRAVPLGIAMSGSGTVRATIRPRFYRAYGRSKTNG